MKLPRRPLLRERVLPPVRGQ